MWNTDSRRMERCLANYILSPSIGFSSIKFLLWHVGIYSIIKVRKNFDINDKMFNAY